MTREDDTLEGRLRKKLENGEISQEEFDELFTKFQDLGILDAKTPPRKRRTNRIINGSKVFEESVRVDGPVIINGSLRVEGDLECQKLNTAGSLLIRKDLVVLDKATISGRLEVDGQSKIGGPLVVAGRLTAGQDITCTKKIKISGKTSVGGELISGDSIKIGGDLVAKKLLSTGAIKLVGKIEVEEDVVCKSFTSKYGGESKIGGDLKAETVRIGRPAMNTVKVIANGVDLSGLINTVVSSFVTGGGARMSVRNIVGDTVEINQIDVRGDIRARNVKLGSDVSVEGAVYYRENLSVPSGVEVASEKVEF